MPVPFFLVFALLPSSEPGPRESLVAVASPCGKVAIDTRQGTWSLEALGRRVIANARVEVVLARQVLLPAGTNFVKFRLWQHGGDWDAYLGYLEFGEPGASRPMYADSFTAPTPRDKYVRAENILWRTQTEGGLMCPRTPDSWAEIVFQTRARQLRWVYQVVHADDLIEVYTSANGQSWKLLTRKSGEGGITPRFRDEHAVLLQDSEILPLGPGRWTTGKVQDKLGPAQRITYQGTVREGLKVTAQWSLLETEPVVLLDLALANTSSQSTKVFRLHPAANCRIDSGAPAERCTVLGNDYWFGTSPIARLDQQTETTPWWGTAVIDRASERAVILGIAEAANAGVTVQIARRGVEVLGTVRADLSPTGMGVPLVLPAGGTFALGRLLFFPAQQYHAGLERYGELMARQGEVRLKHRAYSGLFTGYSSSPDLTTVACLDEKRVVKLLSLVKEKVGPYGLDFIKIEFEPMGSPNLLNPRQYQMEKFFPKGPRALVEMIGRMGFRAALQSRTFTYVRGGDPREHEKTGEMYRRWTRDWGFRYLMLDFNETDIVNEDATRPRMQVFRDRFRTIRAAVGPEVFIEACMIPYGPVIGSADGFRPSIDFRGGNEDQLLPNFASRYFLHGRVFQLDNEFHDVAQRPFVWGKRDVVTPLEGMRAWVSLCALTGYSYLLGGAMEETSDERWAILSRALPPSGSSARPLDLAERPLPQIWSLRLSGERPRRQIIALFNWDYEVGQKIEVKLTRCGLDPTKSYAAFDFWGQKFLGEVKESLGATLLPRHAQIVWLTEITEGPQLIGGSRHLAGPLGSTLTSWDPAQRTLRGSAYGHGDLRVSLFLYVPQRWAVSSAQGAVFEQVEPRVIRLDVPTTKDPSNWAVTFDPLAKVR